MHITFVIPTLNEEKFLPKCLQSIRDLERPEAIKNIEIIVVDNKSTDSTSQIATQFGARVVTTPPHSISRSRNVGARESKSDLIAFIDADCELSNNWLTRCVSNLDNEDVVATGATMAPPATDAPWVEVSWHAIVYSDTSFSDEPVEWLASFNMVVRRVAFDKVGGFDENLITAEDCDLGYKLRRHGTLVLDYVAWARHHGESKTLREFFRRELWRGQGSVDSLKKHWSNFREIRSVLVPPFFFATGSVGLLLLFVSVKWSTLALSGAILVVGTALMPVAMLLKKRVSPLRFLFFFRCWILFCLYLVARTFGLFIPARRVVR